jgi:hypothetical protein
VSVAWENLKRQDGSGAEAGMRFEIAGLRFVLAAYDPGPDMWLIAPADSDAARTGSTVIGGSMLHESSYIRHLDLPSRGRDMRASDLGSISALFRDTKDVKP